MAAPTLNTTALTSTLDTIKGSDFLATRTPVEYFVAECPRERSFLELGDAPSAATQTTDKRPAFGRMSVKRTLFPGQD